MTSNDFNNFGTVNSKIKSTLTYLFDEKYLQELNNNSNISAVITTQELASRINKNIKIIKHDDPVSFFANSSIFCLFSSKVPYLVVLLTAITFFAFAKSGTNVL